MGSRAVTGECWNRIGIRGDASCRELKEHVHCRNCPVYGMSAMELLDRDLPDGHLAEWTEHFAAAKEPKAEEALESVLIFRVEGEWLALPTRIFQEVADPAPVHTVPHRRGGVLLGLVNVRGELMVCVSLAKVLGIAGEGGAASAAERPGMARLLVIGNDGHRVAVPVNEVLGVHRYTKGDLKPVPVTLVKAAAAYSRGILSAEGRTVGYLDDELLFRTVEKGLA